MRESARPVPNEAEIVSIWERQALPRRVLDRLGLQVVFRGLPSDAGGPDYQDAYLVIDSILRHGDIEFHARSSDWYTHRHDRNPAYNGVILHVVWIDDSAETRTAGGGLVRVLPLAVDPDPRPLLAGCEARIGSLTSAEIRGRLAAAGQYRLNSLADRFRADLTCADADTVLYAALLEALGYASNRAAFRRLAEVAPLPWLLDQPAARRPAVLLEAAGLVPGQSRLPPGSWRLARIRPANHPRRRVIGVAHLLNRLGDAPARTLVKRVEAVRHPTDLRDALTVRADGETFIGPGRADEIVASVVLPFALASGVSEARSVFERYPAPPENRWTRNVERILTEAGYSIRPRTAAEHQGMHYLYHRHCRLGRPARCPLCSNA